MSFILSSCMVACVDNSVRTSSSFVKGQRFAENSTETRIISYHIAPVSKHFKQYPALVPGCTDMQ